jgi:glycolate oxidase FAD binding subunit
MDLTRVLPGTVVDPAAYAIRGRAPRIAVRPESHAELAETLRAASAERLAGIPWGGGTSAPRDRAPERYDLALDLTGFARIVEYNPEDMTLTAECGATLAELRGALAERGQELPIEGAEAGRATLGGALAANASGPRRLRFGSPRDRLLGARFALSDGTLAHTGGRVVKNVAGHAVHRLLCGSRGGLAALFEASLKLVPAPAMRRALIFHADPDALRDAARWAPLPRLEPAAVTVLGHPTAAAIQGFPAGPRYTVVVVLEDDAPWVERQATLVEAALGAAAARLEGDAVVELGQALCDAPDRWQRRLSFTTARNSVAALGVINADAASSELVFHSLAGRLHLEPGSEPPATEVHRLAGVEFALVDSVGIERPAPVTPPLAAVGALRRRIREAFDPASLWARGSEWERGGA